MLTKISRSIGRWTLPTYPDSLQDRLFDNGGGGSGVVHRDYSEKHERRIQPQPREVVEIAPDFIRWGSLETPFPTVAFGGYIKFYKSRKGTSNPPDSPSITFDLTYPGRPPASIASTNSRSTTTATGIRKPVRTPRETRRYSALPTSSSSAYAAAEKRQGFMWKRATCIITSSIAEHQLSPLFSSSSSQRAPASRKGRPSSGGEISSSPPSSRRSSGASSFPDSTSSSSRFRNPKRDSDSTSLPPASIYSNDEAPGIIIESISDHGNDLTDREASVSNSPSSVHHIARPQNRL